MDDNLFEGLVTTDENMKLVGRLAEHWQITEEAYVAALPERTLPDGRPATAAHVASLIEAAWKGSAARRARGEHSRAGARSGGDAHAHRERAGHGRQGQAGARRRGDERASPGARENSAFQGRVATVRKARTGAGRAATFEIIRSPTASSSKKPELMSALREKLPELLAIGEHNPIVTFHLQPGVRWHDGVPFTRGRREVHVRGVGGPAQRFARAPRRSKRSSRSKS